MNKSIYLATAALAFAAMPAQAATVVYTSGQSVNLIAANGIYSGAFEANVLADIASDPAFTADFFFTTPFSGTAAASAISIALNSLSNLDFTSIAINGVTGTVMNGIVDRAFITSTFVPGGLNTLRLTGNLNPPSGEGNAAFGGNVTFAAAAIPEPTTWALFILGFGAIGFGLRRRSSQVRVAKANLSFA